MPRYYFHLQYADGVTQDVDGTELADLAAAKKEATASARELVADAVKAAKKRTPISLIIADDKGSELDTVPLKEVLPKDLCDE